jgi:hypothetical protein
MVLCNLLNRMIEYNKFSCHKLLAIILLNTSKLHFRRRFRIFRDRVKANLVTFAWLRWAVQNAQNHTNCHSEPFVNSGFVVSSAERTDSAKNLASTAINNVIT